jgi:hypothetical protein
MTMGVRDGDNEQVRKDLRLRSFGCVTCTQKCSFPSPTGAHALHPPCLQCDAPRPQDCIDMRPCCALPDPVAR